MTWAQELRARAGSSRKVKVYVYILVCVSKHASNVHFSYERVDQWYLDLCGTHSNQHYHSSGFRCLKVKCTVTSLRVYNDVDIDERNESTNQNRQAYRRLCATRIDRFVRFLPENLMNFSYNFRLLVPFFHQHRCGSAKFFREI